MKTHDLEIDYIYLEQLLEGKKTCELRNNDRDFQCGDHVCFMPSGEEFEITHVLTDYVGLESGYAILSLKRLPDPLSPL